MEFFKKRTLPVDVQRQLETLTAENAELKQQATEQADALVELAALWMEGTDNG